MQDRNQRDAETGLARWQTETDGIQVQLTQIRPDQARGFSHAAADHYAAECIFMTVVHNIGGTPIRHRLAEWRYVAAREPPRSSRSKAQREYLWKQLGGAEPARIGFTWAQFHTAQTFATRA